MVVLQAKSDRYKLRGSRGREMRCLRNFVVLRVRLIQGNFYDELTLNAGVEDGEKGKGVLIVM